MELRKVAWAIGFIIVGILSRLYLHQFMPSAGEYIAFDLFAVVGVITLLSGTTLRGYYTFIVPLSIMSISDVIIGNSLILFFTWSGFAIIGLSGLLLKSSRPSQGFVLSFTGLGVSGVIMYDIWTNLGWWFITPFYPHTPSGLILCYTMALPFIIGHLLTVLVVFPMVSIPVLYAYHLTIKLHAPKGACVPYRLWRSGS